MSKYVLKAHGITKKFGHFTALNNVSINLEAGKIYGLIGQNGAGKTTLMRLIVGLSFPSNGIIELFGHSNEREIQKELRRIGSLIEYPSLNGNMNAKDNMKLHRIIRGIPNEELDSELLETVGLKGVGKKKVKDFSLGMRQRLGIAIALISNPELLILDEPVNGLDPVGVVEIRNLIKKLNEERHITILISSHNLPELYEVSTDYIILHKGEVKKILSADELSENCKHHIKIQCNKPELLASVIEEKLKTTNYRVMPDKSIKLYDYLEKRELVSKTIYENGIIPTNFSLEGDTLENYFLSIVGGGKNA